MVLINRLRHPSAVHIMKRHVPEFHAWKCHGKGIKTMMNPMKAKTGYRG
jgi:hypothetical protein